MDHRAAIAAVPGTHTHTRTHIFCAVAWSFGTVRSRAQHKHSTCMRLGAVDSDVCIFMHLLQPRASARTFGSSPVCVCVCVRHANPVGRALCGHRQSAPTILPPQPHLIITKCLRSQSNYGPVRCACSFSVWRARVRSRVAFHRARRVLSKISRHRLERITRAHHRQITRARVHRCATIVATTATTTTPMCPCQSVYVCV